MRFTLEDKSWLDGPVETGAELVACCRVLAGKDVAGDDWNAGALMLANWILTAPGLAAVASPSLSNPFAFGVAIEAMLACDLSLRADLVGRIAKVTGGAVRLPDFDQVIQVPVEILNDLAAIDAAEAEEFLHGPGVAAPIDVFGQARLGDQLPSGPLFQAVWDGRTPNDFLLTGMGLTLRLSVPAAASMRDALDAGIRACRPAADVENKGG